MALQAPELKVMINFDKQNSAETQCFAPTNVSNILSPTTPITRKWVQFIFSLDAFIIDARSWVQISCATSITTFARRASHQFFYLLYARPGTEVFLFTLTVKVMTIFVIDNTYLAVCLIVCLFVCFVLLVCRCLLFVVCCLLFVFVFVVCC